MRFLEDLRGPPTEVIGLAFAADGKPPDRDAVHLLETGVELVAPRDVVGRTGRQHLDLGVSGEVFRDIPGMQLGATVQVGAVALDDDGQFHCSSVSAPPLGDGGATVFVVRAVAGAGASLWPGVGDAGRRVGDSPWASGGTAGGAGGSGSGED